MISGPDSMTRDSVDGVEGAVARLPICQWVWRRLCARLLAAGCVPLGARAGCVWLMSEEWGLSRWLPLVRG